MSFRYQSYSLCCRSSAGTITFFISDTDSAAGFEETAERGVGIAHVANDFAGHLRVLVAFPSDSGKYRTTCNFPKRNGSVSQDFTS
jgi:hypothetical protein